MENKIEKVQKRDGSIVPFDQSRIEEAIFKALTASGEGDGKRAKRLSNKVVQILNRRFKKGEIPHVEQIQDIVEEVLILEGLVKTAKAYILYREQRRRIREAIKVSEEAVDRLDQYLEKLDWEVQENANMAFSLQGLNHYGVTYIVKKYWLNKIYPPEIREANESGDFHIHNLDTLGPYCVGWDLYDLLMKGFGGVPGKVESKPAKHFDTALMQCVNFLYTLQGEAAGAVSFSNFDTLLSPFIRYDNLNYQQVKQALQEFIFNMSVPTRVGFQNPFSNLTLDLKPSPVFAKMPVIIGGKPQEKTYSEFEEEMKIFDRALYEVYMEGDAKGRPFSVSGDSVCLIKNSGKIKLIEIGEYIDRLMEKKNPIFIKENNCQVLDVRNSNIMTLGIKEGRVVWQKVNFLVRHPVNELLRIWTVGGFNIKATRSHSVFVLKNGKIQSCEASELKVGDWLVSPKIIPRSSSNESLEISLAEEFLKRGKEEGIYIQNVKKKNGKRLWQKRIYKNSIGHVSTLPLSFIKEKLKEIDLSQAKISLRGSKIKIENNLKISDELVEFLGWYVAEGSAEKNKKHGGISLGLNLEKEKDKALHLASLIKKIWPEVPIKIREIKERNLIEIRIYSKLIRRIITEIFGIENKKEKKVPDFIFEISPEKKKIFLKAYFQGDAKITGEEIQVSSISQKLIYGISTLLKQLNVFHTLTEYYIEGVPRWRVNIWGKTDLAPRQSYTISKIPIKESGLIEIVEKILEKEPYFYDSLGRKYKNTKNRIFKKFGIDILTSQSTGLENAKKLIKYAEKLGIEIPSTLKEIEKGEILFLRIKKIESLKEEKMVYDFSTENENFIANQLLVHNTFPIPTINITKDFPWDEPAFDGIFEASAKYGINYFANYINSEMKPEDVRSMCLEANEEILIRNSKKIKRLSIKEVAESYKDGDFDKEGWAECKKEGNLEVLSLNPETLKLEWVPVKRFLKIKDDKAVEVITEDGKISIFSLKHPVSVYTPEGIKMKFAKDLQKGDYLLVLKRAREDIFSNEYQKIEDLVLNEDLAKILGYFVADGNYLFESRKGYTHFGDPRGMQFTFKTGDRKNLEEIKHLIKKVFNVTTHEKQDPRYNTYYLYIYNTEIARKLYKAGFKKYRRLPQILFNSPKSVIESFLEFYFKGDGYEKRKEIHLNDLELSRDLVLLFSLIGKPVTYKLRKRSQRIYLQHAKSKIKKENGWLNNPILAERVPGWVAISTAKVPGLRKSRMVGLNTLEKYNAHTQESLKIKNSDIYLVRVKEIKVRRYKKLKEFYDIELERNHLFLHSLGQISFNCCRLRLDLTELYNRGGGGLFGAGAKTGSLGVVTINLPRIGYLSKTKKEFFERLARIMDLAKESLEIKRKVLENFIEKGLYPYSRYYLQDIKQMRGKYWANHFSTIGLVGMNECLLNFMGENIASKRGRKFALEVLDFMRERLVKYQEETGNIYNLEATPAESTAYRLALKDKERYPDIITAGTKKVPYYTNSSMLPANFTDDLFEALKLQEEIQCKYTGGVVFHIFLGERMQSGEGVKKLVKKVFENFKLPYITITPTFSICPVHGYIPGEHFFCPKCTIKQPCEVYTRIVGYYRPVQQFNLGKQQEFKQRKEFKIKESTLK
jgi:anaerobic ribonucleoside-triphosphate reductase